MKKFTSIIFSFFIVACSSEPSWKPIYDQYIQNIQQANIENDDKINSIIFKTSEELYATNEYATKDEIKMIQIVQYHLRNAIMQAKQDILNYPLENEFTKFYRRLDLVKARKITFSQSAQLTKYDAIETQRAMGQASRSVMIEQKSEWDRGTRNVGKGLGKTENQIRLDQENQRNNRRVTTTCRQTVYGDVICDSSSY